MERFEAGRKSRWENIPLVQVRGETQQAGGSEKREEVIDEKDSRQESVQELGSIVWQSVASESPFCKELIPSLAPPTSIAE